MRKITIVISILTALTIGLTTYATYKQCEDINNLKVIKSKALTQQRDYNIKLSNYYSELKTIGDKFIETFIILPVTDANIKSQSNKLSIEVQNELSKVAKKENSILNISELNGGIVDKYVLDVKDKTANLYYFISYKSQITLTQRTAIILLQAENDSIKSVQRVY